MQNNNEEQLITLLKQWFIEIKKGNKLNNNNFWHINSVGALLKNELKQLNHWKNKSAGRRGNKEQLEKARKTREDKRIQAIKEEQDRKLRMGDW